MKKKERERWMDKKRQVEKYDQREKVKKERRKGGKYKRRKGATKVGKKRKDKQLEFDREDVKRKNLTNERGIILMTYKF